jgi:hypothetical protein
MTVHERCIRTHPHQPHRAQYGLFGVKDCPGVAAPTPEQVTETDQPKPYTDADVETVTRALMAAPTVLAHQIAAAVLDALTAAGWLSPTTPRSAVQQMIADLTRDRDALKARNAVLALTIAAVTEALNLTMEQQAEPGGPDWSHEIAFDADGSWTIGHPDGCPGHAFGDCDVQRLATEQAAGFERFVEAGSRYECAAVGGVLGLGDRVHDDQCTQPICAACGCWCHDGDVDVQQILDDAAVAFANAGTSDERVEVIRDLLEAWYAAWPPTAVTDEHEGIAHQLVAMVYAAEARAGTTERIDPKPHRCPCPACRILAGLDDRAEG